jgi:putative ABC transport system permease protein
MDSVWQDLKFGARTLRVRPAFTLIAVAMLAVGIGANTAVFSAARALLARPLPISDAEHVVVGLALREGFDPYGTAAFDFAALQERSRSFGSIAASRVKPFNVIGTGDPVRISGAAITASYLPTLGVRPAIGRALTTEDDRPGAARVVLIGHDLWQRQFNRDPAIVGRTLTTDEGVWTIVGVMPRGFDIPDRAEMWAPLQLAGDPATMDPRASVRDLTFVARLRPGVSEQSAIDEAQAIAAELAREHPLERRGWSYTLLPIRRYLLDDLTRRNERALLMLMAAVGFLLLICCVNVASLLLVRGVAREREIAVRLALGAGRGRIVRHLLTESLLLGAIGGLAGILVASWLTPALQKLSPIQVGAFRAFLMDFSLDRSALAFAATMVVGASVLFGMVPAVNAIRRRDVIAALKQRSDGDATGHRSLAVLVVAELAVATALLVAAALVTASFARLQRVRLGFVPDHVLAFEIPLSPVRYAAPGDRAAFVERLLETLRAQPGVRGAGVSTNLPLDPQSSDAIVDADGYVPPNPSDVPITAHRLVSPGYLEALGVRLVAGRTIRPGDRAGRQPVVVISEAFARQMWPGQNPIGRRARRRTGSMPWLTVVGVVADVKEDQFNFRIDRPVWYVPYAQVDSSAPLRLIVATDRDIPSVAAAVRRSVTTIDPAQAVGPAQRLDEQVAQVTVAERFSAVLVGALSLIGAFFATCGLYGVVSYSVSRRRGEFGLRMALGAGPRDLRRLVLRHGAALVGTGLLVGLIGARLLGSALSALLFEVKATDPVTFAAVAGVVAAVSLAACYIPARRAASADPMAALRSE